jgi:hypothetical protein
MRWWMEARKAAARLIDQLVMRKSRSSAAAKRSVPG